MRLLIVLAASLLLGLPGCSRSAPLTNTRPSSHALAQAVVDALAGGERTQLQALAMTEQEFRDLVWPELPASRPERNTPFSFVWSDLRQKSNLALGARMSEFAGRLYKVQDVVFEGESRYGDVIVHRSALVEALPQGGGPAERLRVSGSFIERRGAWKVFSYVSD